MAQIHLERLDTNVTVVTTTRGRIWFSYAEPVAILFFQGGSKFRTTRRHSRTTSRHLAQHCGDFQKIDQAEFEKLLGEIA
jgi:hypothetical protein